MTEANAVNSDESSNAKIVTGNIFTGPDTPDGPPVESNDSNEASDSSAAGNSSASSDDNNSNGDSGFERVQNRLKDHKLDYRLVYLDELKLGNIMQRRLCDLTGQWTVPNLFAKSQHIGGLRDVAKALSLGQINEILQSDNWVELVYAVRPDALALNAKHRPKSQLSFEMDLRDNPRLSYVHRERWNKVKRYWGLQPEIEEYPVEHKYLERPRTARKW
ncbi:hypothetical protein IWW42_003895 [Coemansia sp. RSA 1085]|nr:hypothetical protein IWW42_003895 [Coemansia sp. RSA 1085]